MCVRARDYCQRKSSAAWTQSGIKMRSEYSIWLLAVVVLFVANGRDGVHHVHGMVAANERHSHLHHGELSVLPNISSVFCGHVSLIISVVKECVCVCARCLFGLAKSLYMQTFKFSDKFRVQQMHTHTISH